MQDNPPTSTLKHNPLFRGRLGVQDECIVWVAGRTKAGYGRVHAPAYPSARGYAHRLAWLVAYGAHPCIPDAELPTTTFVCHRCDNPPCVRPDHLFLGSASDNALDRERKGRRTRVRLRRVTQCSRGHAYDAENTYIGRSNGARRCRACLHLNNAARRALRATKPKTPTAQKAVRRGATHFMAKVTDAQIREIRERGDAGEGCASLARAFGISEANASRIARRLIWRHVS